MESYDRKTWNYLLSLHPTHPTPQASSIFTQASSISLGTQSLNRYNIEVRALQSEKTHMSWPTNVSILLIFTFRALGVESPRGGAINMSDIVYIIIALCVTHQRVFLAATKHGEMKNMEFPHIEHLHFDVLNEYQQLCLGSVIACFECFSIWVWLFVSCCQKVWTCTTKLYRNCVSMYVNCIHTI